MSIHDADLIGLATAVVAAAGLPTTAQVCEEVANKCFSLLEPSVRFWQSEGLIIPGDNNVLIKCPEFQRLWDHEVQLSPKGAQWTLSTAQFPANDIDKMSAASLGSPNDKSPRKV